MLCELLPESQPGRGLSPLHVVCPRPGCLEGHCRQASVALGTMAVLYRLYSWAGSFLLGTSPAR